MAVVISSGLNNEPVLLTRVLYNDSGYIEWS